MPSTSQSQQGFMGMVHAYKKGALKASDIPASVRKQVLDAAQSMSALDAEHFASTPRSGLPKHVNARRTMPRRTRSA